MCIYIYTVFKKSKEPTNADRRLGPNHEHGTSSDVDGRNSGRDEPTRRGKIQNEWTARENESDRCPAHARVTESLVARMKSTNETRGHESLPVGKTRSCRKKKYFDAVETKFTPRARNSLNQTAREPRSGAGDMTRERTKRGKEPETCAMLMSGKKPDRSTEACRKINSA
jgi:hypothetical protein